MDQKQKTVSIKLHYATMAALIVANLCNLGLATLFATLYGRSLGMATYQIESNSLHVDGLPQAQAATLRPNPTSKLVAIDLPTPKAPTQLSAQAYGLIGIELNWNDNSGDELGFNIERTTSTNTTTPPIEPYRLYATTGANNSQIATHKDTNLSAGLVTYHYRVSAFNEYSQSAYTNEAMATVSDTIPPTPPSGLVASSSNCVNNQVTVTLNWQPSTDNYRVLGYNVYRNNSAVGTVYHPNTTFTDPGRPGSTGITYIVKALDYSGNASQPSTVYIMTSSCNLQPNSPTNFIASSTSSRDIYLSWSEVTPPAIQGFRLERSTSTNTSTPNWGPVTAPGFPPTSTIPALPTSFHDSMLQPLTTYYYRIRAFSQTGESNWAPTISATTQIAPYAPSAPVLTTPLVVNSSTRISMAWQQMTPPPVGSTAIERSQNNVNWSVVNYVQAGFTTYSDGTLQPNTLYYYRLRAQNQYGWSYYSNVGWARTNP